jgi:acyl carrier protein
MQEFYVGLAEILEVDAAKVTPELRLADHAWDSLAVVSTIALIDDVFNTAVGGQALNKCETVGDILALVEQKKG